MKKDQHVVTDADLKLHEKMAIVVGTYLCKITEGNPKLVIPHCTIRHSLRSGNLHIRTAYRMAKLIYGK